MTRGNQRLPWRVAPLLIAAALVGPTGSVCGTSTAGPPTALLDPQEDRIIFRTPVPSAERPQGEVRVVERDGALVVQTLLDTKLPRRVLGRIAEKEHAHWPPESPEHEQALRYLETLERLLHEEPRGEDRRKQLLIDFVRDDRHAFVRIGSPRLADDRLTAVEDSEVLVLARSYVERNMHLIAADSFGAGSEAEQRVAVAIGEAAP